MRNRCPICGKPSTNSAQQLCMNCQDKYAMEKDGRDYKENPCPDVERIVVDSNYGSHLHTWKGSGDTLEIYWKKVDDTTVITFTPKDGRAIRITL